MMTGGAPDPVDHHVTSRLRGSSTARRTYGLTRRAFLLAIAGVLCLTLSTVYKQNLALLGVSNLTVSEEAPNPTTEVAAVLRRLPNPSVSHDSDSVIAASSPYAYAYVIGGVDPTRPSYKGFLYNILISAHILRQLGSKADIVAFFQLSHLYTISDTLPDEDLKALHQMHVKIYYIERSEHESFYDTVLNKFRILQLTQYRRVLLLDGDVMPVGNLDYLFELSDDNKYGPGNSTLRENLIVAGPLEPANAGFFMLTPTPGDYDLIQDIIQKRHMHAEADGVPFDIVKGWGHVIEEGDEWVTRRDSGRNWTFHFAFSDQGLLYYWAKYVKCSFTIVYREKAENWSPMPIDGGIKAIKERILDKPFLNYSNPLLRQDSSCSKFMCDFIHFTGRAKPWLRSPLIYKLDDRNKLDKGEEIWWYFLMVVDHELGLHLDFHNWQTIQSPLQGFFATWRQMSNTAQAEAANAERKRRKYRD